MKAAMRYEAALKYGSCMRCRRQCTRFAQMKLCQWIVHLTATTYARPIPRSVRNFANFIFFTTAAVSACRKACAVVFIS